ncbi:MAG TPA: hypothetical protein VKR80_02145 [Candidatus Limnocylindria bacterium]|nr:hypothetical protein [Candidatus Limnocylindria bacterium]
MKLLPVVAIALFATACGGGAAPAANAPATIAGSAATTSAPAAATTSGPNIADVLKAGKATTYKVTYSWTVTGGGQNVTSTQTWYYKAPNARFDFSAGPGATFSVYALPDATYTCTSAGGSNFCQKSPGSQGAFAQNPAADFATQLQANPGQFSASFAGTQTIAGQQAQCFAVKGVATGGFGDATTCYTSSGVPLKTTLSAQGQTVTMEATAFTTTVTDADFVPPSP